MGGVLPVIGVDPLGTGKAKKKLTVGPVPEKMEGMVAALKQKNLQGPRRVLEKTRIGASRRFGSGMRRRCKRLPLEMLRGISASGEGWTSSPLFDGEDVIQERDGTGNVVATYLHGPGIDDPITMLRDVDGNGSINHDTEVWHYTKDTLGSIKELTNPQGQVVQRYRYDSYGLQTLELDESRLDSKAIENPYAFTGRELDKETGLQYHRARYYEAGSGTFISRDPIWPLKKLNPYSYARNPISNVDLLGLDDVDVALLINEYERRSRASGGVVTAWDIAVSDRISGKNTSVDAASAEHYLYAKQLVAEGTSPALARILVYGYSAVKVAFGPFEGGTSASESQLVWGLAGVDAGENGVRAQGNPSTMIQSELPFLGGSSCPLP